MEKTGLESKILSIYKEEKEGITTQIINLTNGQVKYCHSLSNNEIEIIMTTYDDGMFHIICNPKEGFKVEHEFETERRYVDEVVLYKKDDKYSYDLSYWPHPDKPRLGIIRSQRLDVTQNCGLLFANMGIKGIIKNYKKREIGEGEIGDVIENHERGIEMINYCRTAISKALDCDYDFLGVVIGKNMIQEMGLSMFFEKLDFSSYVYKK